MGVGQRGMGRGIWGHPGKGGGTRAHTKAAVGCFLRVRTLRKKWTQAKVPAPAPAPAPGEASRSRFSRRSTILDYINVIPKAGPLVSAPNPLPLGPLL